MENIKDIIYIRINLLFDDEGITQQYPFIIIDQWINLFFIVIGNLMFSMYVGVCKLLLDCLTLISFACSLLYYETCSSQSVVAYNVHVI